MKVFVRMTAFLVAMLCLLSGSFVFLSSAATADQTDDEVRYTKKVVSVLYDNSGSMLSYDNHDYAKYAMQMLMALLSPQDILVVTPMNIGAREVTNVSQGVEVNLSALDRNKEINRVMSSNDFFANPPVNGAGTPGSAIGIAIEQLVLRGLKDSQDLGNSDESEEHWLIILTDGRFDEDYYKPAAVIDRYISDYPTLKTIFLGLGNGSPSITDVNSLSRKYQFTPYRSAAGKEEFLKVMREVANQISGRYTLDKGDYTVNGSTVTIHLTNSDISFKSLSVIAQDCGAELESATYEKQEISASLPCVMKPSSKLAANNIKNGYSAVFEGSPYFSGGTLVLNFSAPVSKDNLSILVEPALSIRTYLEYYNGKSWERTTAQYINANLTKNDKIRVGYDVYEQATNKAVDINKIFGDVESSVTYAKNSYKVGDSIPLVVGNNEVSVTVSVMDGAYKMYSSTICIIEENPTYYRVEAQHGSLIPEDTRQTTINYTVYSNNVPLSAAALSGDYTWSINVTAPNGSETTVPGTVGADGRIQAVISAASGEYGVYRVKFKVATQYGISREYECDLLYSSDNMTVQSSGPDKVSDSNPTAQIVFSVLAGNQKLTKSSLAFYQWSVDTVHSGGALVDAAVTVSETGDVICDLDLAGKPYGTYRLTFSLDGGNGKTFTGEHLVSYTPGFLEVKGDHEDQLPPGKEETKATYRVLINGSQLTGAQLQSYPIELMLIAPDGTETDIPVSVLPDGTVEARIRVPQYSFGAYDVRFRVEVADGVVGEYTHTLKYYPSTVALRLLGGDELTLTEYQLLSNESGFRFELLLDNDPFLFDNGLFKYSLKVGGIDVTQYATLEGSVLTYAPKSEHFTGALSPGERNVVLELTCPDVPALTATESAKLTVSASTYVIEPVDLGNKSIDRFNMKDVDAQLYFRVLCDGNALATRDLQSIYDGGRIDISDKTGVFTWQFWAPCGIEASVQEVNGAAYIVVSAVQTFDFLDSFPAMLIFCRESPVHVSCDGAMATDSFVFEPSPWWAYAIRILAILLVIHILLWLWPFVIKLINLCAGCELIKDPCKNLPGGCFVTLTFAGTKVSAFDLGVNVTFREKYEWHIGRLFLRGVFSHGEKRLWYHQPAFDFGNIYMRLSKNGDPFLVFTTDEYYPVQYRPRRGGRADEAFRAYRDELASSGAAILTDVPTQQLLPMFSVVRNSNRVPIDEAQPLAFYGTLNSRDQRISSVIFFEKNTNN